MYGRGDARLWFLRHRDLHDSLFMERRLRRSRRVQARNTGDLWQLRITDLYVVVQLGQLRQRGCLRRIANPRLWQMRRRTVRDQWRVWVVGGL